MTPIALPLLLALGACATTASDPIEVTRFSRAPDVACSSVALAPGGTATLEQRSYEHAVGRELAAAGFAMGGTPRYLCHVAVTRDVREAARRRSPLTVGIGGGTGFGGGYRSGGGVGVGASFGVGGEGGSRTVTVTELSVRLRDAATQQVVWEGRAEGRFDAAAPGPEVDRLAAALLRDFPGPSGRTISVP